ncbi:hypothetical protein [Aliikangiella sp. G2MR2-5]|uniref:hypothetical protein n=1 Tax=Aliikangiella sp. G2MR2-5 TaxID=2788943 RepID=UPI0018A9DD54|nr:hypothetical protein [Aliikangiella sp. G2MR2-5]
MSLFKISCLICLVGTAIILGLLGCGGGSESEEPKICFRSSIYLCPSNSFNDPFGISLAFAWYSGQCTEQVDCIDDLPEQDFAAGIISGDYLDALAGISQTNEQEPNDNFEQALAFIMQQGATVSISGTINSINDVTDMVVFASRSGNLHVAYVCREPGNCTTPFYQDTNIYIELYDSEGNVIASTLNGLSSNGQSFTFTPVVGDIYYLSINAIDTAGLDLSYELVVSD